MSKVAIIIDYVQLFTFFKRPSPSYSILLCPYWNTLIHHSLLWHMWARVYFCKYSKACSTLLNTMLKRQNALHSLTSRPQCACKKGGIGIKYPSSLGVFNPMWRFIPQILPALASKHEVFVLRIGIRFDDWEA